MPASVLNSSKAIEVNIQIVRAFVFMRKYALTHHDLTLKLLELEKQYDQKFDDVYQALRYLLEKDKQKNDQKNRNRIGYK